MQQLTMEHKSNNNQQKVVEQQKQVEELENFRERKGMRLALSHNVLRIVNSDTFYVESESTDNVYYFVKYNPDVFEWCCCPDNSTRHIKCKHIFGIEFAIRWGTLKDIDKLPVEAKRYNGSNTKDASYSITHIQEEQQQSNDAALIKESKSSYKDDDYTF